MPVLVVILGCASSSSGSRDTAEGSTRCFWRYWHDYKKAGLNRGVRSGAPLPRKTELPVAGNRGVRIRLPRRGSVVVRGFAIRRCERIHRAFSWLVLTGDRGFESVSLQRGVMSEPQTTPQPAFAHHSPLALTP